MRKSITVDRWRFFRLYTQRLRPLSPEIEQFFSTTNTQTHLHTNVSRPIECICPTDNFKLHPPCTHLRVRGMHYFSSGKAETAAAAKRPQIVRTAVHRRPLAADVIFLPPLCVNVRRGRGPHKFANVDGTKL